MANMTFGVNLIPHNNAPTGSNNYSLGNSNYRWKIYANTINDLSIDNYINPSVMTGATENANGVAGLVPAPTSADAGKFLRGDGTWGSAAGVNVPVQDVQINDVSVLSNGVANVPKSAIGVLGVVKPNYMGISVNGNGELYVIDASTADIKAGNVGYNPIVSSHQHESTFYGLAKAAGVDMASSNNSVGTYTDEAKTAIRSMLGVQNFNSQSIAIVANGDTHAAITSGQYVYVQNHSTLTEGLYAASSAIDADETLSTSNLTVVGSGGLNALLGKIPEQLIYLGTEMNYPLSAAHTEYPMGITLIYTASSTSYPYGTGTVATIRSANARCVQLSFGNSPNSYKMRTADSNGWSSWENQGQFIHTGTETDYPLSASVAAYQPGITLVHVGSSTSYPYKYGNVVTIRADSGVMQFAFNYTPDDYKLRTIVQGAWSDWKGIKDFSAITTLQSAIGIIVDGNKAATAAALGQFVILKNSTISGRTDGLYTAAKAIPANTAINNTYLTAVSGGGLNKVAADLSALNTDIATRLKRIGTIGGADVGTYTYELPGGGFYCVFFRKTNATGDGTQALYLIVANNATSRLQVSPVLALGGSMSFTGAYVNGTPILTLNTYNQTYIYGTIISI